MHTEVIAVDPLSPDADVVARSADLLRRGELVAFPTETVYGLGANALDAAAVAKIFAAKGRPATNPVIVHVDSPHAAQRLVAHWPREAQLLAERFWPGPLTLVLAKRNSVPDIVTAGGPTVAIRAPRHPIALAILKATGLPIAAPSANRSNEVSPTTAAHVLSSLGGRLQLIIDGGPAEGGLESTVLDLTSSPPCLLRPGLIRPDEIEQVIGPIIRSPTATIAPSHSKSTASAHAEAPLRSPGMLSRHYAPRATLECVAAAAPERIAELARQGKRVAWLTLDSEPSGNVDEGTSPDLTKTTPAGARVIVMPIDPAEYAAKLYAVLHELDAAGVEWIIVDLPPATDAWLAIRDRLTRAATPS